MAPSPCAPTCGPWLGRAAVLLVLTLPACDRSGIGTTYPVSGKVTLGEGPLVAETTVIVFKPDAFRGNTSRFEPVGTVDAEGQYSLSTRGKSGAPPGWYKVVVTAHEGRPEHPRTRQPRRPVARSLVPARYGMAETSDLVVEVVPHAAPGAYDLRLTR